MLVLCLGSWRIWVKEFNLQPEQARRFSKPRSNHRELPGSRLSCEPVYPSVVCVHQIQPAYPDAYLVETIWDWAHVDPPPAIRDSGHTPDGAMCAVWTFKLNPPVVRCNTDVLKPAKAFFWIMGCRGALGGVKIIQFAANSKSFLLKTLNKFTCPFGPLWSTWPWRRLILFTRVQGTPNFYLDVLVSGPIETMAYHTCVSRLCVLYGVCEFEKPWYLC